MIGQETPLDITHHPENTVACVSQVTAIIRASDPKKI